MATARSHCHVVHEDKQWAYTSRSSTSVVIIIEMLTRDSLVSPPHRDMLSLLGNRSSACKDSVPTTEASKEASVRQDCKSAVGAAAGFKDTL